MTDNKAMKRAMLALLRSSFYSAYKERVEAGVNSIEDREVIQDIYDQYHALGGNGVIDVFKEELDKLPAFRRKENGKREET